MSWITENKGWLVACFVSALAGALLVLWLKGLKPKTILPNSVMDAPAPVQPVFIHDTTVIVKRLGGSIGIAMPTAPEATPPETVYQKPSPCKPFSLRLKSSPTSLSSVLDSVVVLYFYPSGMNNFEYYNRPITDNTARKARPTSDFLSLGMNMTIPLSDFSRTSLLGYLSLSTLPKGVDLQVGWRQAQKSGWFLGAQKQWRVF